MNTIGLHSPAELRDVYGWTKTVYRLAVSLNHQWAQLDWEDVEKLLDKLPADPEGFNEAVKQAVHEKTIAGPAGWGVDCPNIRKQGNRLLYLHWSATGCIEIEAVYDEQQPYLTARVRRPYAWQPIVAELCARPAVVYNEYIFDFTPVVGSNVLVRWSEHIAERHVNALRLIAEAFEVELPYIVTLSDEDLARWDADKLLGWYGVKEK